MKNILEVENLGIIIDGEKIVKDISFLVLISILSALWAEAGSRKKYYDVGSFRITSEGGL